MFKHIVILLVLSILAIFFMPLVGSMVHVLHTGFLEVSAMLGRLLVHLPMHTQVARILALLIVPLLVGLIPAFVYWLMKNKLMPFTLDIIWGAWLILLVILACVA